MHTWKYLCLYNAMQLDPNCSLWSNFQTSICKSKHKCAFHMFVETIKNLSISGCNCQLYSENCSRTTIQPKWSCRSDIWNFLQRTPYKPVPMSLEFDGLNIGHLIWSYVTCLLFLLKTNLLILISLILRYGLPRKM
jgi:hypothetical protein